MGARVEAHYEARPKAAKERARRARAKREG